MARGTSTFASIRCAVVLLACAGPAGAQTGDPTLASLRTPPSPAFAVLGIEPSAVERPTTPSDAALSFVNKFRQSTLPKDYAFEASPYWLVGRPNLGWRDDIARNIGQSVGRTLSLSVATAETGLTASPLTSLGVGVRAMLSSGRMTGATQQALTDLEQTLSQTGSVFLTLIGEAGLDRLDDMLVKRQISVEDYEAQKQQLAALVLESQEYRQVMARVKDIAAKREGFFLEVAAGFAWDFTAGSWESRQFRTRGIWATPSYEFGRWSVLGVLRYLDDAGVLDDDAVDWGGRAIYSTADYSLSAEYVERSPLAAAFEASRRFVGIAEYRVSPATWVIASFGKDRRKTNSTDTLVAQIALAFSFSKDRYAF